MIEQIEIQKMVQDSLGESIPQNVMEAVLAKVVDMNNDKNAAYSGLGTMRSNLNRLQIFEKSLQNGLLGFSSEHETGFPGMENQDYYTKERWANNVRERSLSDSAVWFRKAAKDIKWGARGYAARPDDHGLSISILFDLSSFKKIGDYSEKEPKIKSYKYPDDGRLFSRVAPREFIGVCTGVYKKDNAGEYEIPETDLSIRKERLKPVVETMKETFKNKPEMMLPIYDPDLNLIWPQEILYVDIKDGLQKKRK
ncbi:MAG: hypothetical protein V4467_05085 [Patescibacteria group bacterium]